MRPIDLGTLRRRMYAPIDISSLVYFRVLFGFIMVWEVVRYFRYGWIERYYVTPTFHFKYPGFEWVEPWSALGMHVHFAVLGLLALMILAGAFYRVATVLFAIGFAYVFLLDQAQYLNHFYMVFLFAFLMCWLPAHKAYSVDALMRPGRRSEVVPAWTLWLMRAQLEVILIFAGLVKINPDWLRLQPLQMWLAEETDMFLLGPLFAETWGIALGAYGVIVLHVIGAPLLLWRRTRTPVVAVYCLFHVINHFVFDIGIFPWFTIAATLMFYPPDWPRRAARWLAHRSAGYWTGDARAPGEAPRPPLPAAPARAASAADLLWPGRARAGLVLAAMALWIAGQVLIPNRHWLYPGDVAWTEEGHRFSWRMMLRDKVGRASFTVRDPATGRTWRVNARRYLTRRQARKMTVRPDMLLQFAHYLERRWREDHGVDDVEVRARVRVSLNGRPAAYLIDPDRDLTTASWGLAPADWIPRLTEDLPRRREKGYASSD